ncbi:MAG: L-lactate MFS transporter [Candidatus Hodarchaeales archaeon]|jgi:OFA family oxalate/formate antiporter-like MFS transporter
MSENIEPLFNRYLVVVGALIVQLCLGSIYAWSIFQTSLKTAPYNWGTFESLLPFATGLATFALVMVLAGKWQDKEGPRKVATVGGILLGIGYILATGIMFIQSEPFLGLIWVMLTYGIIGGAGIGLAYVCPIAALVKWFPDMKGLITGISVAGFGAGALIFAQVETFFIEITNTNVVSLAFLACGLIYLVFVISGAQLLRNPPTGWKPAGWNPPPPTSSGVIGRDCTWQEMIRTPQFYLLWIMFSLAATAGLMTLGILKSFLQAANPLIDAVLAATIVGVVAIFNAAGRIFWGATSDKIGRTLTLTCMFALLTIAMLIFGFQTDILLLTIIAAVIGLCFGGNFALFPSTTADYFGTKNVGNNYGIVFTAYGLAGVMGAIIPTLFLQSTSPTGADYAPAFLLCAVFAIIAVLLALVADWINRKM